MQYIIDQDCSFKANFKDYLSTVPSDVLGPIMVENPDEWIIIMIKKSGIELPVTIANAIQKYEINKYRVEQYLEQIRAFIKEKKNDNLIVDYNLYKKFNTWSIENDYTIYHISYINFINSVNDLIRIKTPYVVNQLNYESMKITAVNNLS